MADVATKDPKRVNINLICKCKLFFHKQQLFIILVITNKGTRSTDTTHTKIEKSALRKTKPQIS